MKTNEKSFGFWTSKVCGDGETRGGRRALRIGLNDRKLTTKKTISICCCVGFGVCVLFAINTNPSRRSVKLAQNRLRRWIETWNVVGTKVVRMQAKWKAFTSHILYFIGSNSDRGIENGERHRRERLPKKIINIRTYESFSRSPGSFRSRNVFDCCMAIALVATRTNRWCLCCWIVLVLLLLLSAQLQARGSWSLWLPVRYNKPNKHNTHVLQYAHGAYIWLISVTQRERVLSRIWQVKRRSAQNDNTKTHILTQWMRIWPHIVLRTS